MSKTITATTTARRIGPAATFESLTVAGLVVLLTAGLSLLTCLFWVLRFSWIRYREPSQGVLLLCGHRLVHGKLSDDYRARLVRAAELLDRHPNLTLVLLGGGQPSEAAVGRDWLLRHHRVDADRLVLEEESTDSLENLVRARSLIEKDQPVSLMSSRYHLGRLQVLATQAGLDVELIPAEPGLRLTPDTLLNLLREAVFLCWFVSGRFWARLARRRNLLQHIGE